MEPLHRPSRILIKKPQITIAEADHTQSVTSIGVNTREAQFSDARPIQMQDASVAGVPLLDENRGFFNRHPSRFDQSRRLGGRSHFVPDPAR